MHILHLITSLETGGAQRALHTLISNDVGVRHTVAYLHDGPYRQVLTDSGIEVVCVRGVLSAYEPTTWWRLTQLIKKHKPDLLHTSLWLAGVLGRLAGRWYSLPVVCDLHSNAQYHGIIRNTIDRFTMRGALYSAVSEQVGSAFVSQAGSVKPTVIKNGIDAAMLQKRSAALGYTRAQFGIPDNALVIGSVGRLVPIKRYDHLLLAHHQLAQRLPDVNMVTCLVGDGPERDRLTQRAQELGIADQVLFLGERRDVYGIYPLFDLFCLPSQSEGLSYALLEAMCFGLPVVISHDGGAHEVIKDGEHGMVVAATTGAPGLVNALVRLATDRMLQKSIKDKNVALVSQFFAPSSMVAQYHLLYKRALARQQVDG